MSGPLLLPTWEQLEAHTPVMVASMRRYLDQIACSLQPGSVGGADLALRCFATFLTQEAPEVTSVADVTRSHVEDYKPWLASRPGQKVPRLELATIAGHLGRLWMFFIRIQEWDWDQAPSRVPIVAGDLPRQDHPLPKALDDAAAVKFLRAAQDQPRMLVRVVCEVLIRTGLRVSELTGLRHDAVVMIGAGHWLHVPVGKLHDDRYLPLHPHLVTLIGDYRHAHVAASNPLLLPRENGKPMDRHCVTRYLNKAAGAAGIGHVHPHQMRHTLATQAINRGMSLEAIAAMLGHHSMDMTLRYARIANRTVAQEYFAVTEKVEALYGPDKTLSADAAGPRMTKLRREHYRRQRILRPTPRARQHATRSRLRVVVGVDGSEASEPALGYAFAHAASTGCGLTAVHTWCWEPLGVNLGEPWTGDWTQIANQEATLVAESLAGWSQKYPDVPVLRHVVRGDPVDELLEQSHGASLLVVGARPAAPLPCPLVRPPASEGLRHRPGPDARTP